MKKLIKLLAVGSVLALAACGPSKMDKSSPVLQGPVVTDNHTPYEPAFSCYAKLVQSTYGKNHDVPRIAIGKVTDGTQKWAEEHGGYVLTQAPAEMVISAFGKMQRVGLVDLAERYDTTVPEMELKYLKAGLLGDSTGREVASVARIKQTDYNIQGVVSEANFNIQSGGAMVSVMGVGGGGRSFTMNVAVDLRAVGSTGSSELLDVAAFSSKQKQIIGNEMKADIFGFFGTNYLFDISIGSKYQEPLQLGVRSTLELASLDIVSQIYGVSADPCVSAVEQSYVVHAPVEPSSQDGKHERNNR